MLYVRNEPQACAQAHTLQRHSAVTSFLRETTMEVTKGQVSGKSLQNATRFWWDLYGS